MGEAVPDPRVDPALGDADPDARIGGDLFPSTGGDRFRGGDGLPEPTRLVASADFEESSAVSTSLEAPVGDVCCC